MKDFFSGTSTEYDHQLSDGDRGYQAHVLTHFSALQGMILEYFGADSGSHEFKVDDIIFKVLEDPDDGYRSHLGAIEYGEKSEGIFFSQPIARVKIETYENEWRSGWVGVHQGYRLVDVDDNHVWLEFGTDHCDDYYPTFAFRHLPKAA